MVWAGGEPKTESELLSIALALLGEEDGASVDALFLKRLGAAIARGDDPLGDAFCRLRAPVARRRLGQTFTPPAIVAAMIARAQADGPFGAIIDGGAGSGRFILAAGRAFPSARLVAVELDPVCAVLLRANLAAAGMTKRATVLTCDYREAELPDEPGPRLFIGNPPYVRHHGIEARWKDWYAKAMQGLGASKVSRLAGLHLHFFARTGEIARAGDIGIFVTAAEWVDTAYGKALRTALCGRLGGVSVHVVDAKASPFPGVMTTAAITVFRPERKQACMRLQAVNDVAALGSLEDGVQRPSDGLAAMSQWPQGLFLPGPVTALSPAGTAVGSLFRVSRGQVTGANLIWVAGEMAEGLPQRFLAPCITNARELFAAFEAGGRLDRLDHLKRVVDLPVNLALVDREERARIDAFLAWARSMGADRGYVVSHRAAWWAVRLPPAAPIVCTYMARRPPVFVRNIAGARLLNIAHGLFPRRPMTECELDAACVALNQAADLAGGRTYAGGLVKFEPGAVEAMRIDLPHRDWREAAE